ncbi:hypothetical protein O6H91_01G083800 [Diphasiastrum complanatum]|uniref:Uncharacterized protein n=1 Tax=Diphasiastrum complanatum TaxID=34168 RepID=A0ACC2ESX9_DIPCM|nr:hypothetical protein O6H91_01G083800 [Diphasiastrum complanatum]
MADHKRLYICLLWIVLDLSCVVASFYNTPAQTSETPVGFSMGYNGKYKSSYDRSQEVEEKCKAILSSSTDSSSLSTQDRPDPSWAIQNELSFENGDWDQAAGRSPLLPFKVEQNDSEVDPVHLASFWITDVNLKGDRKQKKPQVSGVLELNIGGIHQGRGYSSNSNEDFGFFSGLSTLTVLMEGLYIESEADRSVCMLGCTVLPLRSSIVSNPWSDLEAYSTSSPPIIRSCNLMLQLHYPKEMSLTSRAIYGVLTSLSNPEESSYFDPISLVSQLGAYTSYQFKHGDLAEAACKGATPIVKDTDIYRGDRFCATVMQLLTGQWLQPLSNWKCNKSEEYCTKLGPFKSRDGLPVHRNGSQILIQDIRCVELEDEHSGRASNFSAFFRAVLPNENPNVAILRSGLDRLTLMTEGMWKKSSGQLCMIACANGSRADCKIRICLYIPTALSITQRDMLVGTISSLDSNTATSFDSLSFHLMIFPRVLPRDLGMLYKYTKINFAGAILEREVPLGLSDKIKLSLLEYPSNGSYNSLSEDLTVHSAIIPQTLHKSSHLRSYLDFEIIAIEDFIATDWTHVSNISVEEGIQAAEDRQHRTRVGPEEEGELVRVAAQLTVTGLERVPVIFGEGVYNPKTGKMYLVGCREISVPWQVLQNNSFDLVDGLDCNVEVVVQFPPKNAQWLVNPTVSLTITSRRTEDDPFFSPQVSLQTFPILYQEQRKEIISRKSLEGGLSLLTLSLIVACIACQLIYIRNNRDPVPFISLVMLGVQALGYGVPLIIGAEALFAKLLSDRDEAKSSILKDGEWTQVIMYVVKLLILVVFLLNLRLCQKVVKARIRLGTRHPLEPGRVPSEKKVLLIFLLVHAIGFLLVLTIHSLHKSQNQVSAVTYVDWEGSVKNDREWVKEMREYGGLMQDLFLLPQVLGGAIWDVNGKPLRRLYYIGLTVLRMLPHAYNALRTPLFNPYFSDEYIYANPRFDFYSRAGDVAIPLLALALAIAVYIQQRWNGVKWGKVIQTSSSKMMRYGSRIYQRLPSKLFEAELMPSVPTSSSVSENGKLQESTS